jgi:hypothetical protein
MTEHHSFTASDAKYLLQFEEPLTVVADAIAELTEASSDLGFALNSILKNRNAHRQGYALMPDSPAFQATEREKKLRGRLAENYEMYKRDILETGKESIFYSAAEILPMQNAYEYFTNEHRFTESEADFLLKFQNPLDLISDRWLVSIDVGDMVRAIFSDQERTLRSGGYVLVSDDTSPFAPGPFKSKETGDAEKPSVLDRIRRHKEEQHNNPSQPKDAPGRKKHDPER